MLRLTSYPVAFSLISTLVLLLAAWSGALLAQRPRVQRALEAAGRDGLGVITAATLTLLGLIIGFTFSMALGRYDQRKNYEEAEANAIGTEYLRADLLPAADAERVRALLRAYLEQRIVYYGTRNEQKLRQLNARTSQLQGELWSAVRAPAVAKPEPVIALAVAGMNDVLNSQGYTQAAWWNRIPASAWSMLMAIAICSNLMVGLGVKRAEGRSAFLLILPVIVSIAFLLIADIDSPQWGLIRVIPENLISLAESLPPP